MSNEQERAAFEAALSQLSAGAYLMPGWDVHRVRAALAAQQAPAGWKLVSVEPTEAMQYAGGAAIGGMPSDLEQTDRAYRAMLAAAPAAPQVPAVPDGYKLLKDTTHDERRWHEDAKHENGSYYNECVRCLRSFVGHKRRGVCRACAQPEAAPGAPQPAPQAPLTEEQVAEACGWKAGRGYKPLPRELQIARAIEAAHGIGVQSACSDQLGVLLEEPRN